MDNRLRRCDHRGPRRPGDRVPIPRAAFRRHGHRLPDASSRSTCRSRRCSCASLDAGEWRPGEAIPSELELAARFGVSQGTVRKAIDALADDHLVVRRQGKGTFVATHTEEKVSVPRFLRIRRDDGDDEYPASRLVDVRRAKAGRGRRAPARPQAGRPGAAAPARAGVRRRAGRAGRDHAARRAVPRPHAGALRGLPRLDVRLLRDRVRRAHAEGARAAARRSPPTPAAAAISGSPWAAPLLAVERVTTTYGDRPVELRRGLCLTAHAPLPERTRLTGRRRRVHPPPPPDRPTRYNCAVRSDAVAAPVVSTRQPRPPRAPPPRSHARRRPPAPEDRPAPPAVPRRPVYLDLLAIRLPLPALVSILHRASGALLFLVGIPAALWGLQASLASPAAYASFVTAMSHPLAKLVALGARLGLPAPPARRPPPPASWTCTYGTRTRRRAPQRRRGDRARARC